MKKPTRTEVTTWIRELSADADKPILAAAALIKALKSEYATSAQMSNARAIAREILFTSVRSNREMRDSRADDDARLSRAVTYAVDPTGAFFNAFRDCIRQIRATCDNDRAEYLASDFAYKGPDMRTSLQKSYDAEMRLARTIRSLA